MIHRLGTLVCVWFALKALINFRCCFDIWKRLNWHVDLFQFLYTYCMFLLVWNRSINFTLHYIAPKKSLVCLGVGWSASRARISAQAIGVIEGNYVRYLVTYLKKLTNFPDLIIIVDLFNDVNNEAHSKLERHRHPAARDRHSMATQLWNPQCFACFEGMRYATKVLGNGQIIME